MESEGDAMGNGQTDIETHIKDIRKAKNKFIEKTDNFNSKIAVFFEKIVALANEYKKHTASLLNLAEANVELANANVKRAKANVEHANNDEKCRADAHVECCKQKIQDAKVEGNNAKGRH